MTIALGQVFWFLAIRLRWIKGGEDGRLNILRPTLDFGFATASMKVERGPKFAACECSGSTKASANETRRYARDRPKAHPNQFGLLKYSSSLGSEP
jgi:hypothetical protein